jgi:hypothetical protein
VRRNEFHKPEPLPANPDNNCHGIFNSAVKPLPALDFFFT